ncbi:transposase [Polaribacter batillariae]|uniref:Transposase n=1 Tax=Polaribacter batillariae TaxID=2808900 RepID=A0ABX7SWC0_9FLAO|nr:transposase [Polaribacter batillariae]
MEYIARTPRNQLGLFPTALDHMIDKDNSVRAIDIFVDRLDLSQFDLTKTAQTGRPSYNPADLLKLFIYGYMNRMRSSRQLEKITCVEF